MESEIILNGESVSPVEIAAAGSIVGASFAVIAIVCLVMYVFQVIANWKIFTKAGKPGWHSLIPYLNTWDQTDLSWNSTMAWVTVGLMIAGGSLSPIMQNNPDSTIVMVIACILVAAIFVIGFISLYKLAKAFGKGIGFFIGLVFLNPIFMMILGFGNAEYQGKQG